jgi:hypothetical protein
VLIRVPLLSCLLALVLPLLSGCTTTLIPPIAPSHPTTILITDYGKHSSLLLPDPAGGMVEYAFGDWDYFALGHKGLFVGFIALIHSPQATLGRRWVLIDPNAADAFRLLGAQRTQRLIVDSDRVKSLLQRLNLEFARHLDTEIYSNVEQMHFVHCDEQYHVFHNCNNVTADWLKSLGVRVEGLALFSKFRVQPAAPGAGTASDGFTRLQANGR